MFAGIARFVTKRYKAIIVAWIIVLLIAVPLAPKAFEIVTYDESEMAPAYLESEIAQRFIGEHFPTAGEQATTLIILANEDVLDDDTKRAVFRIGDSIFNETHGGRIDGQVRVDTLYSSTELYATGVLYQLNRGFQEAREMTDLTGFAVFGLPTEFRSLWSEVNTSAFVVYGIPSLHLGIWMQINQTNPYWNVTTVDSVAYAQTLSALMGNEAVIGMNETEQALVFGWFSAYATAWDSLRGTPYELDPQARATIAVTAFPIFVSSLPMPPELGAFPMAVYADLDLAGWSDFHRLSALCDSMFESQMDLMLAELPDEEAQLVRGYYDIFYANWNLTASAPSDEIFAAIVESSVEVFSEVLGGEEGAFFRSVYDGLGWSGWGNEFAISMFAAETVSEASMSEVWVVMEAGELPSNASFFDFQRLAEDIVANSSIAEFPLPVLPAIVSSFVNLPTNNTMIVSLTFDGGENDYLGEESVWVVRDVVSSALADTPSIRHYVTGSDAISVDQKSSTDADMEKIDPITIVLVFILIGLFFRSFVASSIPPAVIGVALGVTFAIVYVLGTYLLSVHYSVLTLTLTSMMGAGCDYCIFILSRYREERHNGLSKEESVRTAVTWAGESIATSGATVIIGFGVLSLGRFEMLKSMGIGLATGITIALIAALTLLPAVLMLLGDRMFWPAKMKPKVRKEGREGYFTKSAKFAVKHAKAIVIAAVLVSVPATYTVLTLETSYDFIEAMPETESRQGLDLMGESFGAGRMTPTLLAMEMSSPVVVGDTWNQSQLDSIEAISHDLSQLSNVNSVVSPTRPLGESEPIDYANLSAYPAEEAAQYVALMKGMLGTEDTRVVLITVTFVADPFARESIESIQQIRTLSAAFALEDELVTAAYVGGSTASMYDISNLVWEDFEVMEVFVIIGIYIVLMVVLGSLISPLRSILTILLSISWTLAVTMALFTYLQGIQILWLMPMILMIVCLGLGMDYDIFITTRIREEAQKGKSDREAIVHAMEKTGGIITACGIIMAGAFGTMMLSEGALLREFGFALAFAILLDSIIVRIYLVPAIVSLLGKWNWYAPGRLQRVRREEKK